VIDSIRLGLFLAFALPGGDEARGRAVLDAALAALGGASRLEAVEIWDVAREGRENLLFWLPAERILFQGDLFYYSEGDAFPPSGRETMNRFFAGFLSEKGIEPLAIYGVHNEGAAPPERLRDSIP
jgi:hypothetical protein